MTFIETVEVHNKQDMLAVYKCQCGFIAGLDLPWLQIFNKIIKFECPHCRETHEITNPITEDLVDED